MSEGAEQAASAKRRSVVPIVAADGMRFEACLAAPRGGAGPALPANELMPRWRESEGKPI